MKGLSFWRVLVILMLAVLAVPAGATFAQERGAELVAVGTTTTRVGGQQVASSRQLETVVVAGIGFDAGELIGLWLTLPDGSVVGIDNDDLQADADGAFAVELGLGSGLPVGLHRFSARGQTSGNGSIVPFYLMPGQGPTVTAGTQLNFSPATAKQLDTVELTASGFAPNEVISLWLTLPDGVVVGLGNFDADAAGKFGASFFLPGELPVGRHYVTARGVSSGNTAITPLTLQYGNGLSVPGARLAADLGRAQQRTILALAGEGFTPNESVSFWLTLPNGAVMPLNEVNVDSEGVLAVEIYLAEDLPVGTHYLSFRSNRSEQAGFAKLTLAPGP